MTTLAIAPEHQAALDAYAAVAEQERTLLEFLEWAEGEGARLGSYRGAFDAYEGTGGQTMYPIGSRNQAVVRRFLGVDSGALENARRAVLAAARGAASAERDPRVDPMAGDVLRKLHGEMRSVTGVETDQGHLGAVWYTHDNGAGGEAQTWIGGWRRWAKRAEVIRRGEVGA